MQIQAKVDVEPFIRLVEVTAKVRGDGGGGGWVDISGTVIISGDKAVGEDDVIIVWSLHPGGDKWEYCGNGGGVGGYRETYHGWLRLCGKTDSRCRRTDRQRCHIERGTGHNYHKRLIRKWWLLIAWWSDHIVCECEKGPLVGDCGSVIN